MHYLIRYDYIAIIHDVDVKRRLLGLSWPAIPETIGLGSRPGFSPEYATMPEATLVAMATWLGKSMEEYAFPPMHGPH